MYGCHALAVTINQKIASTHHFKAYIFKLFLGKHAPRLPSLTYLAHTVEHHMKRDNLWLKHHIRLIKAEWCASLMTSVAVHGWPDHSNYVRSKSGFFVLNYSNNWGMVYCSIKLEHYLWYVEEKCSEFSETVSFIQLESQPVPPLLKSVCGSIESEVDPLN